MAKREGFGTVTDGPLVIEVRSMALLTDVRAKERTLITQLNSTHTPNYTLAHKARNILKAFRALQLTLHTAITGFRMDCILYLLSIASQLWCQTLISNKYIYLAIYV